ncbi:hypothetical protein [Ruegeria lacuscaerulensis]|uniref:hypothetical protein n=1 Tax=Ruegeria lacuscaerulensis TaxID=55218 RepID=UPI00147B399C|nr:hypothetical protein [Ruegeria lacuscaerulensis]
MKRLNIPLRSRVASRNLLFAGCVNGSPETTAELNRCRRAYAGLFSVFLAYTFFFLGTSVALFFLAFLVLNFLTARPYEISEGIR